MDDTERSIAAARLRYLTDLVEGHAWAYAADRMIGRVGELTQTCINPLTTAEAWERARGGIDALQRIIQAPHDEMRELAQRLEEES